MRHSEIMDKGKRYSKTLEINQYKILNYYHTVNSFFFFFVFVFIGQQKI